MYVDIRSVILSEKIHEFWRKSFEREEPNELLGILSLFSGDYCYYERGKIITDLSPSGPDLGKLISEPDGKLVHVVANRNKLSFIDV